MKPGDIVTIYEDLMTQKEVEGDAKLIERIQEHDDREYWLVEFVRDHRRTLRWIITHVPLMSEFHKKYPHHSDSEEKNVPYSESETLKRVAEDVQYFIDEEEKGIGEYETFIEHINNAIAKLAPNQTITRQVLTDAIRRLYVILQEQRSHVSLLKEIKKRISPE